nr:MAG TPA: Lecithin retinol acyltransferase [Caudoviricetes sp.]
MVIGKLNPINKDDLKVGDVVGVAREVRCGWGTSFRHVMVYPAKIIRITPKRTKIETDKFGEHNKYETLYKYDSEAIKEGEIAKKFKKIRDGIYAIENFKSKRGLGVIKDEDLDTLSEHINAVVEVLKRYGDKEDTKC